MNRTNASCLLIIAIAAGLLSSCTTFKGGSPEASVRTPQGDGPLARTFTANHSKFAACGRESVSVQTGMAQDMKLRFVVTSDGTVDKVWIEEMSGPDPDLRACIVKKLKRLKFPPPSDGQAKTVTFPLSIKAE